MINKLTTIIMAINITILLAVGYLMFWPAQLSIVYNEPFPVYPQVVKRGDPLSYTVEMTKRATYDVHSSQSIICADGNLVTLADKNLRSSLPEGDHTVTDKIIIPEKVSDGRCYLQLQATYEINPLRDEHRIMKTEEFIVIR